MNSTNQTKTFFYSNNSFKRSYDNKAEADERAARECFKYNIRLETWTFEALVAKFGEGNARRMWNR